MEYNAPIKKNGFCTDMKRSLVYIDKKHTRYITVYVTCYLWFTKGDIRTYRLIFAKKRNVERINKNLIKMAS